MKKLLALLMVCLILAGCAAKTAPVEVPEEATSTSEPEAPMPETPVEAPIEEAKEEPKEDLQEETAEDSPAEDAPKEEPPTNPDKVTFKEAEDLMRYLDKLGPLGGDDFGGRAKQNVTVDEAVLFIKGWKDAKIGLSGAQDISALNYLRLIISNFLNVDLWENIAMQAVSLRLVNGIPQMNTWDTSVLENMFVTREEAAQILLNSLNRETTDKMGNTVRMYAFWGVYRNHMYDDNLDLLYRPQVQWISVETNQPVTDTYTVQPVYSYQNTPDNPVNTCTLLDKVGFFSDFNLWAHFFHAVNGNYINEVSKAHWGHADGSGCQNEFDFPLYDYGVTVEIYEYDWAKSWWDGFDDCYGNWCELFRAVTLTAFLGNISTNDSGQKVINIYGLDDGTSYGDWVQPLGSSYEDYADGWYLFRVGTDRDGVCMIYDEASFVNGTLTAAAENQTEIDGEAHFNSSEFHLGKNLVTQENIGKNFYFFLDQYGNVLGCTEENPVAE